MECPVCKHKEHLEIDTHADGYAKNLMECGDCGALWITETVRLVRPVVINGSTKSMQV